MEGTVNKAAGLVFLLCRCGDRDFHVYLSEKKGNDGYQELENGMEFPRQGETAADSEPFIL